MCFQSFPSSLRDSGNFVKTLKIRVKLMLDCPRAHTITYTNCTTRIPLVMCMLLGYVPSWRPSTVHLHLNSGPVLASGYDLGLDLAIIWYLVTWTTQCLNATVFYACAPDLEVTRSSSLGACNSHTKPMSRHFHRPVCF